MQLFTFLSVILACIVAAAAIPLRLVGEDGRPRAFRAELEQALRDANAQIVIMKGTIAAARQGNARALACVRMAFGPHPRMGIIENNIRDLRDMAIRVLSKDYGNELGITGFLNPRDPQREEARTEFGRHFYTATAALRAYTVLHEAAHALWQADDDYLNMPRDTRMLWMGYRLTDEKKGYRVRQGGYALRSDYHHGDPITEADLKSQFKYIRGMANNMDQNADSYALFGLLCSQLAASQPGGGRTRHTSLGGHSARPGDYVIPTRSGDPSGSSGRIRRPSLEGHSARPGGYDYVIPTRSGDPSGSSGRIRRTSLAGHSARPGDYVIPTRSGDPSGSSGRTRRPSLEGHSARPGDYVIPTRSGDPSGSSGRIRRTSLAGHSARPGDYVIPTRSGDPSGSSGRTRRPSLEGHSARPGDYVIPTRSGDPSGSSGRTRRPSLEGHSARPGGYDYVIPTRSGDPSGSSGRIRRTSLAGHSARPGEYVITSGGHSGSAALPGGRHTRHNSLGLPSGSSAWPGGPGGPTPPARRPSIFSKLIGKFKKPPQN